MAQRVKREYDYVYLTNTPSFYKLNLCQRLGETGVKVLLVLYGYGAEAVNKELNDTERWSFDYEFLYKGDSNKRSVYSTFKALRRLMRSVECKKVLFAGWMANEYNLYSFLSSKRKNVMVVESTIKESQVSGFKGWIKRRITGRMSSALPSGVRHTELLRVLGFKGRCEMTGSVGIFHKPQRPQLSHVPKDAENLKYLYVGRLIDCKNLEFLVEQFNKSRRSLTIVGAGDLELRLKSIASDNIKFLGFVANEKLNEVYQSHDVFILPSKTETWGMVVEEAIYFGLPVIVSSEVGCGPEMVEDLGTGVMFKLGYASNFEEKCVEIERDYAKFAKASALVDFDKREQDQVQAYLKILNE